MPKVLRVQLQLLQALPAQRLEAYALHQRLETHFHDACIGGHASGVCASGRHSLEGLSHKQQRVSECWWHAPLPAKRPAAALRHWWETAKSLAAVQMQFMPKSTQAMKPDTA